MTAHTGSARPPKTARDPRLDFFRGIAMLIIFMAHVPGNLWNSFIPARFGASDAAEMFVFCSGFAAAIAFGGTFLRSGFWMGTARVVQRIFTLYIAHIFLFLSVAILVYAVTASGSQEDYIEGLNLYHFFDRPGQQLLGLFTLTYVPNYFDIMPMYMGVLAMMPLVMLCAKVDVRLAFLLVAAVYVAQWTLQWDLPAAPFDDSLVWFFNPFGWQLLFFTGFFLSRGWIQAPPVRPAFIAIALFFVVLGYLADNWALLRSSEGLREFRDLISPYVLGKTDFGLLRYLHFLSLAYLCVAVLKGREAILYARIFDPIRKVGQQALATFLFSMFISRVGGMVIDILGREAWVYILVNMAGMGLVVAVAYLVGWFKGQPWRQPRTGQAGAAAAPVQNDRSTLRTAPAE